MAVPLAEINALDAAAFTARLGGIYEHSPWIAQRAWPLRPFASVQGLHAAMQDIVNAAQRSEKLELIRAHPELAGRLAMAGQLTDASRSEQSAAGLNRCTPEEFALLQKLNAAYRGKFGFPFIVAVRGLTRAKIIASLQQRLDNTQEQELAACMQEIGRIARFRLQDLIED
jgi:2-oxo-4-hydroxy-4-carboxy-5-ureidoimidazoline decarboxylase